MHVRARRRNPTGAEGAHERMRHYESEQRSLLLASPSPPQTNGGRSAPCECGAPAAGSAAATLRASLARQAPGHRGSWPGDVKLNPTSPPPPRCEENCVSSIATDTLDFHVVVDVGVQAAPATEGERGRRSVATQSAPPKAPTGDTASVNLAITRELLEMAFEERGAALEADYNARRLALHTEIETEQRRAARAVVAAQTAQEMAEDELALTRSALESERAIAHELRGRFNAQQAEGAGAIAELQQELRLVRSQLEQSRRLVAMQEAAMQQRSADDNRRLVAALEAQLSKNKAQSRLLEQQASRPLPLTGAAAAGSSVEHDEAPPVQQPVVEQEGLGDAHTSASVFAAAGHDHSQQLPPKQRRASEDARLRTATATQLLRMAAAPARGAVEEGDENALKGSSASDDAARKPVAQSAPTHASSDETVAAQRERVSLPSFSPSTQQIPASTLMPKPPLPATPAAAAAAVSPSAAQQPVESRTDSSGVADARSSGEQPAAVDAARIGIGVQLMDPGTTIGALARQRTDANNRLVLAQQRLTERLKHFDSAHGQQRRSLEARIQEAIDEVTRFYEEKFAELRGAADEREEELNANWREVVTALEGELATKGDTLRALHTRLGAQEARVAAAERERMEEQRRSGTMVARLQRLHAALLGVPLAPSAATTPPDAQRRAVEEAVTRGGTTDPEMPQRAAAAAVAASEEGEATVATATRPALCALCREELIRDELELQYTFQRATHHAVHPQRQPSGKLQSGPAHAPRPGSVTSSPSACGFRPMAARDCETHRRHRVGHLASPVTLVDRGATSFGVRTTEPLVLTASARDGGVAAAARLAEALTARQIVPGPPLPKPSTRGAQQ